MAFYGKVALITGGASGLGQLMAQRLAKQGAKVAILDINEQNLAATAEFSSNIVPYRCDVTDLTQVREVVERVEQELGSIDRLAHCAAIMPGGWLRDVSAEHINNLMRINYFGMVNVVQTVLPKLKARNAGDCIVFGSLAGVIPVRRFGAYGATKAANNFFMRTLILENQDTKIRFQLICPPAVDTPLINQATNDGPQALKKFQATGKNIATPESIIDSMERALERGSQINFPGQAAWVNWLYRYFPSLTGWIVNRQME